MSSTRPADRRKRAATLDPDCLETRQLLTGGQGNTFAIMPVAGNTPGGTTKVEFSLPPSHFTIPKGRVVLGVDTAVPQNSTARPVIGGLEDPQGRRVRGVAYSLYDPRAQRGGAAANDLASSAAVATLDLRRLPAGTAPNFKVNVGFSQNTAGNVLVGFYLPGDVNGDGTVDKADIKAVRSALGSVSGDERYNFEADANRDGRISFTDVRYAQQNEGVKTTISPVLSANLDSASDTGVADRVTTRRDVKFAGATTPGARISFTEAENKSQPVTVEAGPDGKYSVDLRLGDGSNTFRVKTTDAFGQSISGSLAPVTYHVQAPTLPGSTIPGTVLPGTRTSIDGTKDAPSQTVNGAPKTV